MKLHILTIWIMFFTLGVAILNAETNFANEPTSQDSHINMPSSVDSVVENLQANTSTHISAAKLNADLSIMGLYKNADIVVKTVICILIAFSLLTWTVFLGKCFEYRLLFKIAKRDKAFLSTHNSIKDDIESAIKSLKIASYVRRFYDEFENELTQSHLGDSSFKERIKYRLEHRASMWLNHSKRYISLLASVGSSAPFIGLFGTVWGIMDAFIGIAKSDNTSLAVVAPGIAEALFATAFGLAAAIPAVLFYNLLIRLSIGFNSNLSEILMQIYCLIEREIYARSHK